MSQPQQPTEEQVKFLAKKKEHIQSKTQGMVPILLGEMLQDDLPYLDVHYIFAKALQVLEQTVKKVSFFEEKVRRDRKALLAKALKEFMKKKIKLEVKKPKDSTDVRDRSCERVVQIIIDKVMTPDVVLSDEGFINEAIDNDDEVLLYSMGKDYLESIYQEMTINLREHERRALKELWGDKEREDVTMSDLDRVLKAASKMKKCEPVTKKIAAK